MTFSNAFTRRILFAAVLLPLAATEAYAQAVRPARRCGEQVGLELGIEGNTTVARGDKLRFALVSYEVVGVASLRTLAGAEAVLATSLAPLDEVRVTTDSEGRASVEVSIPVDAPPSFAATLRLRSPCFERHFDLAVQTIDGTSVRALVPASLARGAPLPILGQLEDFRGVPLPNRELHILVHRARGRGADFDRAVRTDAHGSFSLRLSLPASWEGPLQITVRDVISGVTQTLGATIDAQPEPSRGLVLLHRSSSNVVASGALFDVELRVRDRNGLPIAGAKLRAANAEWTDEERALETGPYRTSDEEGRAVLQFRVPPGMAALSEFAFAIDADALGYPTAHRVGSVRVGGARLFAGFSVVSGALVPELGGRVYVRVATADGHLAVGAQLTASTGALESSDASGIVQVDVPPFDMAALAQSCGGTSYPLMLSSDAGSLPTLCIPIAVDGTLRLDARRTAPDQVRVDVRKVRAIADRTLRLFAALRYPNGLWVPLDTQTLRASEAHALLHVPSEGAGELVLRVRSVLNSHEEQGALMNFSLAPTTSPPRVVANAQNIVSVSQESEPIVQQVWAMPGFRWGADVANTALTWLGAMGWDARANAPSTPLYRAAKCAELDRADTAAPFLLQGQQGRLVEVPLPAPDSPETLGLLRDPHRLASRYVRGRLGLVLRALETFVGERVPDRMDQVMVRSSGRHALAPQIFASLSASDTVGSEGPTSLGGETLTLEDVQRFDLAVTYDNVARRITRERLFRVSLALRDLVHERGYDLPWARIGDPNTWLLSLARRAGDGELSSLDGTVIEARHFVDAWGQPLSLQASRGAGSPLGSIAGLTLTSAGPDGRFGTSDDMSDPTREVLPQGAYADAVGESSLVARLRGVEFSRATLELLDQEFQSNGGDSVLAEEQTSHLDVLPNFLATDPNPFAYVSNYQRHHRFALGAELELPRVAQSWLVLAPGIDATGSRTLNAVTHDTTASLLIEYVPRVHAVSGRALSFDVRVANPSADVVQVAPRVLHSGGHEVAVRADALSLPARSSTTVHLSIQPRELHPRTISSLDAIALRIGDSDLRIQVATRHDGLVTLETHMQRLEAGRSHANFDAESSGPARAILIRENAAALDPELLRRTEELAPLLAWSLATRGQPISNELEAAVVRVEGTFPTLGRVLRLLPLSRSEDPQRRALAQMLEHELARANANDYVEAALIAGALAEVAHSPHGSGPLHALVERSLPLLRARVRDLDPLVAARAASGLLTQDHEDGHGLVMYQRAKSAFAETDGHWRVRSTAGGLQDDLAATGAMWLAARALADSEVEARCLSTLLHFHSAMMRGSEEVALRWLFLWSLTTEAADGDNALCAWVDGAAENCDEVPIRALATERTIDVHSLGPALVRFEQLRVRPLLAQTSEHVEIIVRGADVPGLRSMNEIVLRARRSVAHLTVLLPIAAGHYVDEALLTSLRATGATVEVREPSIVQMDFGSWSEAQELTIPVSFARLGGVRGEPLRAVAFDRAAPSDRAISVP